MTGKKSERTSSINKKVSETTGTSLASTDVDSTCKQKPNINNTKDINTTQKEHTSLINVISIVLSILATVISIGNSIVTREPKIFTSAPDPSIVEEINGLGEAIPAAAVKITNPSLTDANNLIVTNSNANIYFLYKNVSTGDLQILTRLPYLYKGDSATVLFYPHNIELNGMPPTKPSGKHLFNGKGHANLDINYSYESKGMHFLWDTTSTNTFKTDITQNQDASNIALVRPAAILPNTINTHKLHKDISILSLAGTGNPKE